MITKGKKGNFFQNTYGKGCNCPDNGCCELITSFTYDDNTFLLTLTTSYGNTFQVDLSSLAPDGVVNGVSFDPVTNILTVTTTTGSVYNTVIDAPIVIENSLFVMENGSDVTGQRTRLDLPFATLDAAMTAALPGDTVHLYTTDYVIVGSAPHQVVKDQVTLRLVNSTITVQDSDGPAIFADNGSVVDYKIIGDGAIISNRSLSDFQLGLTGTGSTLSIKGNIELDVRSRIRNINPALVEFVGTSGRNINNNTVFSFRNSISYPTQFIWIVDKHIGGNATYSSYDFRNFSASGRIHIEVNDLQVNNAFPDTSYMYFSSVACKRYIRINKVNDSLNSMKHFFTAISDYGEWDLDISGFNIYGYPFKFQVSGPSPVTGKISFTGKFSTPSTGYGISRRARLQMNLDSRVNINLDVDVAFVNINTVHGIQFIDLTDAPAGCHISGRVLLQLSIPLLNPTNQAAVAPFRFDNPSPGNTATLKDFVCETNTDYLYIGNGPTQLNIPSINVITNTNTGTSLNPPLHAAVIQAMTDSPALKA